MNIKKKGFTIVELVIVIAVVAILAAVLIPTFASLINKANMSSDQRAVRDMNIALALDEVDKEFSSIADVRTTLKNAGYSSENFVPLQANTKLYWIPKLNRIILADENHNVLYPTNLEGIPVYDENATGDDMWVPLFQENALIIDDAPPVSVTDYPFIIDEETKDCWITTGFFSNYDIDLSKCQKLVEFNTMENGENTLAYQIDHYGTWRADYVITLDDDFAAQTGGIIGGFETHDRNVMWAAIVLDEDLPAGTEFHLLSLLGEEHGFAYSEIIASFGSNPSCYFESFVCGAFNYSEENIGKSITVQLRIYENNNGEKGKNYIILNEITCEFTKDFIMPLTNPNK